MWIISLQVVVISVLLQVPGCFPSCIIVGTVANCQMNTLRSVPALPSNITHLFLDMNRIGEINPTTLSGLEDLLELDLGHQLVPLVIKNDAFSKQRRLRKLDLGSNSRLRLEPRAFAGLSSLQDLQLYHCSLNESILEESYLEPLSSLETLNLYGNNIKRLQPSSFFVNMTHLTYLNLKLNRINQICESDLASFRGLNFTVLDLQSVGLLAYSSRGFDWEKCGNPFRGMSFEMLDLSYNGFGLGKEFYRAIGGTKISHLLLKGPVGKGFSFNNLPDPDRTTFEGLRNSSVRTLDLSKNRIFALQPAVFSPLTEVRLIDVSQNKVNQIQKGAFEGLQGHLQVLNLSHNLLGEVFSHTFDSLTNLKLLDLSHNHIGALGFQSFRGLPDLNALYLTGNSLRDLGFPSSLPRLNYLLFADNKMSSMSSLATFAPNLMYLNIQDNRLKDLLHVYTLLNELKNLQHLSFGGNTISRCMASRFDAGKGVKQLQSLDLHSSSLDSAWSQDRCLHIFDNLANVLGLNLSHNALQALPEGIFKGLTSVVQMDLSSNALTYLQPESLPKSLRRLDLSNNFIASPDPAAFSSLSFLDLNMNRFYCDPNLNGFLSWLSATNVTLQTPAKKLRCEFPFGFYKVPLLTYAAQVSQQ